MKEKKYNKNETFVALEIVNFFLISLFARKHIKLVRISELTWLSFLSFFHFSKVHFNNNGSLDIQRTTLKA